MGFDGYQLCFDTYQVLSWVKGNMYRLNPRLRQTGIRLNTASTRRRIQTPDSSSSRRGISQKLRLLLKIEKSVLDTLIHY